jgi:hypothetical protein
VAICGDCLGWDDFYAAATQQFNYLNRIIRQPKAEGYTLVMSAAQERSNYLRNSDEKILELI